MKIAPKGSHESRTGLSVMNMIPSQTKVENIAASSPIPELKILPRQIRNEPKGFTL
jgi:hypothetical protein